MKERNPDYQAWIEWNNNQENPLPPLTVTQYDFIQFCLDNRKEFEVVGDIESVFKSVRQFLKSN